MDIRRYSIGVVLVLAALALPCHGQVASDSQMASEALLPYVGSRDRVTVTSRLANERQRTLDMITGANSGRIVGAAVVFNTGITPSRLRAMTEAADLTVSQVDLKAPVGTERVVNSLSIGTDDLTLVEGNLEHRLLAAIAIGRERMLEMSAALPGEEREAYRAMALGPQRVYSVRLFGQARQLQSVMERRDVALLRIVDTKGDLASAYQRIKEKHQLLQN
jgi:hypothetical protein